MAEKIVERAGATIPFVSSATGRRKSFASMAEASENARKRTKPVAARRASRTGPRTFSDLVGNSFKRLLSSPAPEVGSVNSHGAARQPWSSIDTGDVGVVHGVNDAVDGGRGGDGSDDGGLVRIAPSSPASSRKGAAAATAGSIEASPRTPHGSALSMGRSKALEEAWTTAGGYIVLVTPTLALVSTLMEALEAPQVPTMGFVVVCPLYEWNQEQDDEEIRRLRTFPQVGRTSMTQNSRVQQYSAGQ